METITLEIKPVGKNGYDDLRNQLDKFVKEKFYLLYEGAVRLGLSISGDFYAPERIQINNTRLHATIGLKYADGHKYSDDEAASEKQLRQTIKDLQTLINAATEDIQPPFKLNIVENK